MSAPSDKDAIAASKPDTDQATISSPPRVEAPEAQTTEVAPPAEAESQPPASGAAPAIEAEVNLYSCLFRAGLIS